MLIVVFCPVLILIKSLIDCQDKDVSINRWINIREEFNGWVLTLCYGYLRIVFRAHSAGEILKNWWMAYMKRHNMKSLYMKPIKGKNWFSSHDIRSTSGPGICLYSTFSYLSCSNPFGSGSKVIMKLIMNWACYLPPEKTLNLQTGVHLDERQEPRFCFFAVEIWTGFTSDCYLQVYHQKL